MLRRNHQSQSSILKSWERNGKASQKTLSGHCTKLWCPYTLNMALEPCHCPSTAIGCSRPEKPQGMIRHTGHLLHPTANTPCLNGSRHAPAGWVPRGSGDHSNPSVSSPCLHPGSSKVSRWRDIRALMSLNQPHGMSFPVDFSGTMTIRKV